jgi:hypothetical protein
MTFRDGTVVLATKAVQRGKATLTTSKLVPGDHPLTATYSPTGGSAVTSAPLVQHVARGATTTSVASSKPTYYVGQSGNLTATVKAVAPAPGVPTGAVDFAADGYPLATVPLSSTGRATLPLSTLSPGTSSITATYSGSDAYDPSTTPVPLDQTVLVNVPVAGATFTPTTVAPGGTARLVLSATNVGPTALTSNVALGALVPMPFRIVSMPPGQLCGVRRGLVYCLTSVPKGGTSRLVLDVTGPPTPGTYTVSAYARNIDTGDETYATATLTVA